MKIIIDLQGMQRDGNRKRGIGRYCLEITKSLIHYHPENEYILFTNSALFSLRDNFSDELNSKKLNVIYFECPTVGDINERSLGNSSNLWLSIQLRSYALSIINADIILITSFFDGFRDNSLTSQDRSYQLPPIVSIVYDLIPLILDDQYLEIDPEYKLFYLNKIKELSSLHALLAISDSSLNEAKLHLAIDPNLIFNISSACNQKTFSPSTKDLRDNIKFLGRFLLYCGATDPRKNLFRLIEAYASLPLDLIVKHKLVLVGPYKDEEIFLIRERLFTFGLPHEYVVFLGYVTDSELVNLYSSCYLFIFPSLHEGFGLPVLEAMNCGAAVIASNLTSLPELIGTKQFLFDPYDPKDIASLIYKSLTNKNFYEMIVANSLERIKLFSWESTSKKTIDSLTKIINKNNNLTKNSIDFMLLFQTQYQILIKNIQTRLFVKDKIKSNSDVLKLLASAMSLINSQSKKIELTRRKKKNGKLTWHVEGPFDSSYSLAILNRNYALAMNELGEDVSLFSTEGPGDYDPDPNFLAKNSVVNNLFQKANKSNESLFICSRNLYPPRVNDVDAVINLLHAYGWEETAFPYSWVESFNSNLSGITVMSNEVKKILMDNGVYIPITVCGLGVDHIDQIKPSNTFIPQNNKFSFLHISSCFPRKGIDTLFAAYFKSFTSHDDVILIIKTFKNPHNQARSILNEFNKKTSNPPEVLIIDKELSLSEIQSLYLSSNAIVAPSHGEGFNLTVAEGMRLGVPVITTAWGGQTDFCNTSNSWLIDFSFEYSKNHLGLFSSVWAKPSISSLSKIMIECYKLPQDILQQKAEIAAKTINNFTWRSVAQKNVNFVRKLLSSSFIHPPKIGWVTTWNSRCGIATYSRHLVEHIQSDLMILAPENETIEFETVSTNVQRCWSLGEDNLEKLYQLILNSKLTSLVIQFNFGFYNFLHFKNLISKLHSKGIKIIIFMHSTIDPPEQSDKCLDSIVAELQTCDRILVHTPSDLNRLKEINLVSNVSLFPHGVLNFDHEVINNNFSKGNQIHLSSYGFCLPNKGLIELIKAVNIIRNQNYNVKLTLYCALYPSETSIQLSHELKELVTKFKLDSYISINHSFVSHKETLLRLSKTDLIVFPYQFSNESASGAVRQGISSKTPVAVTPLPIFDDVSEVVHRLPGFTPQDIADGIIFLLDNNSINSSDQKIKEWIDLHKFSKLAGRLIGLIRSLEINS